LLREDIVLTAFRIMQQSTLSV